MSTHHPTPTHSRYDSTRNPQTSSHYKDPTPRQASLTSHDSDSRLSYDSSRGFITCGAKIRSIGTNRLKPYQNMPRILHPFAETKPTHKDKSYNLTTEKQRQKDKDKEFLFQQRQKDRDKHQHLTLKQYFKRSDSMEMDSTKTDSPRVSTIFTNKLNINAMKLSTDPSRIQFQRKVTMESILLEDRQRLEKLVKEKISQIIGLNKLLNEERRGNQSRIRQLELEIEMGKYTHQQMTSSYANRLEGLKKEGGIKDTVINQLSKELKELQGVESKGEKECRVLKEGWRKEAEEWKGKVGRMERELGVQKEAGDRIRQENLELGKIIEGLNVKIEKEMSKKCNCNLNSSNDKISPRVKVHKSLQKSPTPTLLQPPSLPPSPRFPIIKLNPPSSPQPSPKTQQHKKSIKKLQQSQKLLLKKIQTLQHLLDECNTQMLKDRIKASNANLKQRY